jgi:hypothetical protein
MHMNGQINYLKLAAIVIVGLGSFMAIYRGDTQAGYTLLAALLGYVFGNAHGMYSAKK